MVDINSMFPSQYIKSADIKSRPNARVTIRMSHVKVEEVGDDKKPVLYFQGAQKGLVLNVTNARTIQDITGTSETDQWRGVPITLFVTKVEYQGKRQDGIRVDYPDNQPKPAPPTQMRPAPPVVTAPMTPVGALADAFTASPEDAFSTEAPDDDLAF